MGCTVSSARENSKKKKNDVKFRFARILDSYTTLEEVQAELRNVGLESSNLIVGVDFTKSNTWTGKNSFNERCLHDTTGPLNPYQHVLTIIGRTLEPFDDDHLIPVFGFGDSYTTDKSCFPFYPDRPCHGLQEVVDRYREIAPGILLSGPTSFGPVIDKAIEIVRAARSYHILLIVADGQVTDETATVSAIVRASAFPLSIVLVGVGDGPWDMMRQFDDDLPQRQFDNFQFACFTDLRRAVDAGQCTPEKADACMALSMLMEVPEQYKAIKKLRLLSQV
jgi:E3 ubiquitin-protein ligase RGLG